MSKIRKELFLEQLHKDLKFLNEMNEMDYSLLVGIHCCNNKEINKLNGTSCTTTSNIIN